MIHHGDLFDVLTTLEPNSLDACVTDPPYGLEFMGKAWDKLDSPQWRTDRQPDKTGRGSWFGENHDSPRYGGKPQQQQAFHEGWAREVFRVLKPGAHLLAFGGTRTYHRMTCAIEDAGFEIRDCLAWLYGSGFPKSLNFEDGWGTALKPAYEPIVVARKPLVGSVKANRERFGTGAINVDACRIGSSRPAMAAVSIGEPREFGRAEGRAVIGTVDEGRWPANVALDEAAAALLDEQSGEFSGRVGMTQHGSGTNAVYGEFKRTGQSVGNMGTEDFGGASRFFYVAKPSRDERDMGCWSLPERSGNEITGRKPDSPGAIHGARAGVTQSKRANTHPTVKPIELMRWLVRLVTPADGVVLDPFTGSGTTGCACAYELRKFIGIEREAEYVEIATRRIRDCAPLFTETEGAL